MGYWSGGCTKGEQGSHNKLCRICCAESHKEALENTILDDRWSVSMRVIGLTGGIATGKSTVSNTIQEDGIAVVDCDKIAHAVVKRASSDILPETCRF